MLVKEVKDLLEAEVLHGDDELLEEEVETAFSSDMMSDVLAHGVNHSILITSLCNPQVIRTAELLDIVCIIFVRNKKPDEMMLNLASNKDITILGTKHKTFTTCGLLYQAGIK